MTAADPGRLLATLRSALAHELNQPLAVARGYLELLQSRDDAAMRETAPRRIGEAIERAALVVDGLARLIELDGLGGLQPTPGGAALAAARERAGALAAARDVQLDVRGEPGPTDDVALGAILATAVERAERGSVVHVEAGPDAVRVRWQGEALAPATADAIRADEWRGDTTSLGPHVARRRLELLGGGLEVGEQSLAALSPSRPAPR